MIDEAEALGLYAAYAAEAALRLGDDDWWKRKPAELASGRTILAADPNVQVAVMRAALGRQTRDHQQKDFPQCYKVSHAVRALVSQLCKRNLPFTTFDVQTIIRTIAAAEHALFRLPAQALLRAVARPLSDPEVLAACRDDLEHLSAVVTTWYASADQRKFMKAVDELLSGARAGAGPEIGDDEWGRQVLPMLESLDQATRADWLALLAHCGKASGSVPSAKWTATARELRDKLEPPAFIGLAADWIGTFRKSSNKPPKYDSEGHQFVSSGCILTAENADLLRGLIWCCTGLEDGALAAALADAAIAGYRKVPGVGPRSAKVAAAAVYALKSMPGLDGAAQLERVRLGVKQPTYLKAISKALDEAAQRAGMTRDDLEELTVPTFDLDANGCRRVLFGAATAELSVAASDVALRWYDAAGKPRKAEPAEVKRDFKAALKDLKRQRDDIVRMLGAQRDRLERLPLAERSWPLHDWHRRYLDHPLVGTLARRLIWHFTVGERSVDGIWLDGQLVDAADQPLDLPETATVAPWHPALCDADTVLAWRECLERHQVTQPFKQAHREIYLLTDAERETRVYSNRFAAHILRQHQFNALCAARGWRNTLRLLVDDEYPPATLELPHFGLRAEFWIEGAGDQYDVDTNETGTYLRVATDQVRFYPLDAAENYAHAGGGGYRAATYWRLLGRGGENPNAPIALEHIPPLVFSEVMRDVDLFVGVASVGNDPTWQDGGPEGRYRDYWQAYSFGNLSATAQTRKELLGRLIPRLAIADRCAVDGRFLRVRGDLRTYNIHLGSGNILMEPNGEYLCIVPNRRSANATASEPLFLPFEGDSILAIILSKAFLLAEDTKITDPTITRQIQRR